MTLSLESAANSSATCASRQVYIVRINASSKFWCVSAARRCGRGGARDARNMGRRVNCGVGWVVLV